MTRNIPFDSKRILKVFFKDNTIDKVYVPDLVVYDGIIVELKAVKEFLPEHEAQLFNYMRITKFKVGYLINFGNTDELKWKRYIITG